MKRTVSLKLASTFKIQRAGASLLLATATMLHAEVAKPTDSVADAVGVNTHFGNMGSAYVLHQHLAVGFMREMGVRHYHDGISYLGSDAAFPAQSYAIFNELGESGMHGDYVINCSASLAQNEQMAGQIYNVEAVEYPNEYDVAGDTNWPATLRKCGAQVWSALRGSPSLPYIGPSFVQTGSPAQLGPVPMTNNNLHSYFFNYPPDINYLPGSQQSANAGGGPCVRNQAGSWDCFPGLKYGLDNAQADGPGKPTWITETGYFTSGVPAAPGQGSYVPAQYEPAYFVREVLWALNNGVPRVYFYALLDDPNDSYGLVDGSLQPKPGFYALANLIHLMTDRGSWKTAPSDLQFSLSGGDRSLMHSLFEKSDGTFYLVLWLAASDWDGTKDITPAPETVSVNIPGHTILSTDTMQRNGVFLPAVVGNSAMKLPVGTSPIFLLIR